MLNARSARNIATLLCTLFVGVGSASAVSAASPSFSQAVGHYKAGQYRQAASEFKLITNSYPTNAMSHYYMALCYQSLGNRSEARQEFNLTSQYGDATLKGYASKALRTLGSTGISHSGSSSSGAGSAGQSVSLGSNAGGGGGIGGIYGYAAIKAAADAQSGARFSGSTSSSTSSQSGSTTQSSSAAKVGPVSEVIEFYTDWCSVCRKFEPVFSATQQQMKGVNFTTLNAEDSSNAALVDKYKVSRYPTLVYLDRAGNVLKNQAMAYNTPQDFATSIRYGR